MQTLTEAVAFRARVLLEGMSDAQRRAMFAKFGAAKHAAGSAGTDQAVSVRERQRQFRKSGFSSGGKKGRKEAADAIRQFKKRLKKPALRKAFSKAFTAATKRHGSVSRTKGGKKRE